MPYYSDDKKSTIKGLLIGAGVTAAVLGRKQIGRIGAKAIEWTSNALVHNKAKAAFSMTRNLETLERRLAGLEYEAVTDIAHDRMNRHLEGMGWNKNARNLLFGTQNKVQDWTQATLGMGADVLQGNEYRGLLTSLNKDAAAAHRDIIAARAASRIQHLRAGAQDAYKSAGADYLPGQLEEAKKKLERSFLDQMMENSRRAGLSTIKEGKGGYSEILNRTLGLEHVTLLEIRDNPSKYVNKLGGEAGVSLQNTVRRIEDMANRHGIRGAGRFKLGELVKDESGNLYDTRESRSLINQGLGWLEANTQIPMIPFREGFSPASLFSWMRSKDTKFAASVSRHGMQMQLGISDLTKDQTMSGMRVGEHLIGLKFGANVAPNEVAQTLATDVVALDSSRGFGKRALQGLYASQNTDFTNQTGVKGFLNIGNQMERSFLDKILQVANRAKDPTGQLHPLEAMRRALEDRANLTEEGVDALSAFIYRKGRLHTSALELSAVRDVHLNEALTNLESNEAVLKFFDDATGNYTSRLRNMLHEYRSSGGSFANNYMDSAEESILGTNLLGTPRPQRGIDAMRHTLQAEYIETMKAEGVPPEDIIDYIRSSTQLTKSQKLESESVVRSFMSREARGTGAVNRANIFTEDETAIRATYHTLEKNTSKYTVVDSEPMVDMPPSFIVRKHQSVMAAINDALKSGGNPLEKILNFAQDPAAMQYYGAFFQGVTKPENFSQTSLTGYFMAERVNRMLTSFGLALGPKDLQSSFSIWAGLGVKRVLPVMAGYELYNQFNNFADDMGMPGLDEIGANVGANIHLLKAKIYGGLHASQLFPGSEKYFNNTSYEEERERLKSGYEPIRANKFWLFGSRSEFMGGKIKYFLPDKFQRATTDWESAENTTISSPDALSHSWIPSLKYPLAPLMKLLDPYSFEERMSSGPNPERPFVKTGPLFAAETPWGPALNSTVGNLIKPVKTLHPQYDPQANTLQEMVDSEGGRGGEGDPVDIALSTYDEPGFTLNPGSVGIIKPAGGIVLQGAPQTSAGASLGSGGGGGGGGFRPGRGFARAVISAINSKLKAQNEMATNVRLQDQYKPNVMGYGTDTSVVQELNNAQYMQRSLQELHGIYGWGTALAFNADIPFGMRMADSSQAYGIGERFWDMNLGGLGGEANEVFRRFLPKRPRTVEYFNPVPNSFAGSWLPGDSYFQNMQRGDVFCVSPETLIETGPLTFTQAAEVSVGFNLYTHIGNYSPVTKIKVRTVSKNEKIYKLKVMSLTGTALVFSENHPILVVDNPKKSKYAFEKKWELIKDIQPGQYAVYPKPKYDKHDVILDLATLTNYPATDKYIYIGGRVTSNYPHVYEWLEENTPINGRWGWGERTKFLKGHGWTATEYDHAVRAIADKNIERLPRYITITEEMAYFFGLFLAEGWTSITQVHFSMHSSEEELFNKALIGAKQIDPTITTKWCPIKDTEGAVGRISSSVLTRMLFNLFGKGAKNKLIPEEFASLPNGIILCLLHGLFDGDGCFYDAGRCMPCLNLHLTNQILLLQVRKLLLSFGIVSSITKVKSRTSYHKEKLINSAESWALSIYGDASVKLFNWFGYPLPINYKKVIPTSWSYVDEDYIYLKIHSIEEVPHIPEVIGYQVDGDESFCVAGVATHNSKLENGLMRLPSASYERLHGVKLMQTRASSLGGSVEEIAQGMLQYGDPMSSYGERVTEAGDVIHRRIQDTWKKQGVLRNSEIEIYNDKLGISGHIDALLNIKGQAVIGEIKSMSAKKFNSGEIFTEHLDQLNFYLHTTGIHKGLLAYVNRDDPSQFRIMDINYDPIREKLVEFKVARARQIVSNKVESGEVSRAQLYDPVTRFEILADVGSYSQEFTALSSFLAQDDQLSEAQKARVQNAKKRARDAKKRYSLYGYHFTHGADLSTNENFTVKQIIDPNTIETTSGDTIKLAGIRASEGRAKEYLDKHPGGIDLSIMGIYEALTNKEYGSASEEVYAKYGVRPGVKINVEFSEDPADQQSQDMFRSLRGQVFVGNRSLNKTLLSNGIGEERENDWSAPGINVRFNPIERGIGSAWEAFSHLDTPFHTKLLRVRTPLEEYKRTQVYGSNSGDWAHPIKTFVTPSIEAYASRHPIIAAGSMGLFASMFGKTAYAKKLFASVGAVAGFALSAGVHSQELVTGEKWIPGTVQKRRDIEEYYDKLKYVKFTRLYNYAVKQALDKEDTDVEQIIERNAEMGEIRKSARNAMKKAKSGRRLAKAQADLINERLKKITEFAGSVNLGPWATQALLYKDQFESTFYGYEEGAPYKNVMRAIPKYEREIVANMVKDSTPSEKKEFFELLPEYEKPALAKQLGINYTGKKQKIDDYFEDHTLPDLDWEGWNPQVNLNSLKARTAQYEGVDSFAMGIYPQEIEKAKAETKEISVPTIHGSTAYASTLVRELLQAKGINPRHVNVEIYPDNSLERNQIEVEGNVKHSRTKEIIEAIRGYM